MKNNKRSILEASIIIFVIILLCLVMMWLVNQVFNGAFKEWFYNRFYVYEEYPTRVKVGAIFRNWSEIKQFFINIFFTFLIILAISTSILAHLYARYRSKKEITFITETMSSYIKSNNDDLTLPQKYSEIEIQLIKIKAISQKHQQLVETEMQRKRLNTLG